MKSKQDWVHHNLHNGLVSVRLASSPGRRVSGHYSWVVVDDATPHVSVAGRASMLEKKQRSVHATIWGRVVATELTHSRAIHSGDSFNIEFGRIIRYNPWERGDFHYVDSGKTWTGSKRVVVMNGYAYEVKI